MKLSPFDWGVVLLTVLVIVFVALCGVLAVRG